MTRAESGEGTGAGEGREGYEFYIQYLPGAVQRLKNIPASNFPPTFPKYFVVIVISVAYKLLTSTVN